MLPHGTRCTETPRASTPAACSRNARQLSETPMPPALVRSGDGGATGTDGGAAGTDGGGPAADPPPSPAPPAPTGTAAGTSTGASTPGAGATRRPRSARSVV